MVGAGRVIAEPRLSPNALCLAFFTVGQRGAQLVRVDLSDDVATAGNRIEAGPEVVLTTNPQPVGIHPEGGGSFCWLPDSSGLVYAGRDGGMHWISAVGGVARLICSAPESNVWLGSPDASPDGEWIVFTVNSDDANYVGITRVDGTRPVIVVAADSSADFRLDPVWVNQTSIAWHEWSDPNMPWDSSRIVALAVSDVQNLSEETVSEPMYSQLVAGGSGGSVSQPRSVQRTDGRGFLAWIDDAAGFANVTIASIDSSYETIFTIDEPHEQGGPTWGGGSRTWCWSPDGTEVAYCRNEAGFGRLCRTRVEPVPDSTSESRTFTSEERILDADVPIGRSESLRKHTIELGRAVHYGLSWSTTPSNRQRIAAIRTGGRTPTQLVVYQWDAATSDPATRTVIARGPVGGWEALDTPEPATLSWVANDGAKLHGRMYLPPTVRGVDASGDDLRRVDVSGVDASGKGNDSPSSFPLIVSVHGGPTGQTMVQFNARFAYWLNLGWAIFVPDYRGSTGWGRAYRSALNGLWGELDVTDVWSGIQHVLATYPVAAQRVVAMGGSAGGFTVLNLISAYPDAFAAAVALYPVTDLAALDATTHRYERHYNTSIVGPSHLYRDRSPISKAASIKTPLLVLHGDSDRTVGVEQSRALVSRLREYGAPVAFHVYEGEGHGWKQPETTVDELQRIDSFLLRYVSGLTGSQTSD
jgi:dipeptidyl aminopeptidase/acylaminoacyl peptidase